MELDFHFIRDQISNILPKALPAECFSSLRSKLVVVTVPSAAHDKGRNSRADRRSPIADPSPVALCTPHSSISDGFNRRPLVCCGILPQMDGGDYLAEINGSRLL
jgi:hypothetical protein